MLRKRAEMSKLKPNVGLSQNATPEERFRSNKCGKIRSEATPKNVTREVSLLEGSQTGSGISPLCSWRQCVSIAIGLLVAALLALTQAWCVNAIHENLLWFSELTVRVIGNCSSGAITYLFRSRKRRIYMPL